jgi:enamine deaminase RidA (YjgF/YER057c/UK114 family)
LNTSDLLDEATLPAPRATTSPFLRTVIVDDVVHLSGQLPYVDGRLEITGSVGDTVTVEEAQAAARLCALNALGALVAEIGTLARVRQVVRLTGYVAAAAGLDAHPKVIDGASAALLDYLGERGRHARTAIGVRNLPHNAPVEVDLIVAIHSHATRPASAR